MARNLAEGVVLYVDSGGKAPALARAPHGRSRATHALLNWTRHGLQAGEGAVRQVEVNGQSCALMLDGTGRLTGVMAFDIAGG